MAWKVVSTTTEQVVDTNPFTWLESGCYDFDNGNFSEAVYKFEKVIEYSKNSNNKDYFMAVGTLFFAMCKYELNQSFDYNYFMNRVNKDELISLIVDASDDGCYISIIKILMQFDNSKWEPYWRKAIVRQINSRNKNLIPFFDDSDWKIFSSVVENSDIPWIIERFDVDEFKQFLKYFGTSKSTKAHFDSNRIRFDILGTASYFGRLDILKCIYENKEYNFDINYCMIAAVLEKKYDCLVYSIENGADVNKRFPEINNRNALMVIAAGRHWDSLPRQIYNYILSHCKCDLNLQDYDGNTAPMLSLDHSWFWNAEVDMFNAMATTGWVSHRITNDNGEDLDDIAKKHGLEFN